MKLQAPPATEPRAGWRETIIEQKNEIRRLIDDSPSLRRSVDGVIAREVSNAVYQASTAIRDHGEAPLIDLESAQLFRRSGARQLVLEREGRPKSD